MAKKHGLKLCNAAMKTMGKPIMDAATYGYGEKNKPKPVKVCRAKIVLRRPDQEQLQKFKAMMEKKEKSEDSGFVTPRKREEVKTSTPNSSSQEFFNPDDVFMSESDSDITKDVACQTEQDGFDRVESEKN